MFDILIFFPVFCLLELGHRLLVIRVAVRMVLHCQAAVGFFQILLAGVLGGPQHFVIISFGHNGSALFNVDFKLRRRTLGPGAAGPTSDAWRPTPSLLLIVVHFLELSVDHIIAGLLLLAGAGLVLLLDKIAGTKETRRESIK